MSRALFIALVGCLITIHQTRLVNRCDLAKLLQQEEMDGFEGYSLSDWLCLAFMESDFNTLKVNENADGSFDYGIFQINSHYWCNDHQSHSENICHLECQELLNPNLLSTIHCARKIVSGTGCIKNWRGRHCRTSLAGRAPIGCDDRQRDSGQGLDPFCPV